MKLKILMTVYTYISWLSQLGISVSKLTELMERALFIFQEMLAELCFILLLQSIDLALISVEAVIV